MSTNATSVLGAVREYISKYYPYGDMVRWLTYHGSVPLDHREVSHALTLFDGQNDIYCRFGQYSSAKEWSSAVSGQGRAAYKFDLGAIYDGPAAAARSGGARPCERELVFDIDSADYDHLRRCGCTGRDICVKCWRFMATAIEVIATTLENAFGFTKALPVFSGGRGIHLWVADAEARAVAVQGAVVGFCTSKAVVDQETRRLEMCPPELVDAVAVICDKFCVETGAAPTNADALLDYASRTEVDADHVSAFISLSNVAFSGLRLDDVRKLASDLHFRSIYESDAIRHAAARAGEDHGYYSSTEGFFRLLQGFVPLSFFFEEPLPGRPAVISAQSFLVACYSVATKAYHEALSDHDNETVVVSALVENMLPKHRGTPDSEARLRRGLRILLRMHLCAPRIDAAVTVQLNHLLKAPFSVHARSHNVCLPLCRTEAEAAAAVAAADAPGDLVSHFVVDTFDPTAAPFSVRDVVAGLSGDAAQAQAAAAYRVGRVIFDKFVADLAPDAAEQD